MPYRSLESDLVCDGRTYLTAVGSSFHLRTTIIRLSTQVNIIKWNPFKLGVKVVF